MNRLHNADNCILLGSLTEQNHVLVILALFCLCVIALRRYSVRRATTGSFFAALLDGIIPDNKVSAMLIAIRTTAT